MIYRFAIAACGCVLIAAFGTLLHVAGVQFPSLWWVVSMALFLAFGGLNLMLGADFL